MVSAKMKRPCQWRSAEYSKIGSERRLSCLDETCKRDKQISLRCDSKHGVSGAP